MKDDIERADASTLASPDLKTDNDDNTSEDDDNQDSNKDNSQERVDSLV